MTFLLIALLRNQHSLVFHHIWVWMMLFFSGNHGSFGSWVLCGFSCCVITLFWYESASENSSVTLESIWNWSEALGRRLWEEMTWTRLKTMSLKNHWLLWEIDNVCSCFSHFFAWLISVLKTCLRSDEQCFENCHNKINSDKLEFGIVQYLLL